MGTLKLPRFRDEDESLFGMFDGGHNNEIPKILVEKVPDVVKAELKHNKTEAKYMKYAMLTSHRSVSIWGNMGKMAYSFAGSYSTCDFKCMGGTIFIHNCRSMGGAVYCTILNLVMELHVFLK